MKFYRSKLCRTFEDGDCETPFLTAPLKIPLQPGVEADSLKIHVCPPHLHTHTNTHPPLSPSSVTLLLSSVSLLPTFLQHPPASLSCFYLQPPRIKKILTLHETGRLWSFISSVSQERTYKGKGLTDSANQIFQFPLLYHFFSLSSPCS